jgi:hypothetical protein
MVELFVVPTRTWLDWGVNLFSQWLGFQYKGPGGLPENFFQTLPDATYLRRMVSTYLSPLGIAYTALLVFPLAVVFLDRQRRGTRSQALAAVALIFLLAGILFSVTRLAMFALAGEAVLLAILIRTPWVYIQVPVVLAAIVMVIAFYPRIGPVVDSHLNPVTTSSATVVTAGDSSFAEHLKTILADMKVAAGHPLGAGLGSSGTSANRFTSGPRTGSDYAPGESAVLTMFVDTGVLGGLAYVALYVLGMFESLRGLIAAPRRGLESALPMVAVVGGLALIPITLTSDLWGDLSVTFLFWWAIGYSATLAARREAARRAEAPEMRRQVAAP